MEKESGCVEMTCSVKLFQTSSSLSFAKLSKLSSKHRATQSKTEPKLVLFKANTVAVYSLQKQTKQRNTRSALPKLHHQGDLHLLDLAFTIMPECCRRGALFSENSKSHVILEVFLWALNCFVVAACAGAVFYENLVLPCVFSIDFEG